MLMLTYCLSVQFYVLWDSLPSKISADPSSSLAVLFSKLQNDLPETKTFPATATLANCTFYELKTPVLFTPPKSEEGDIFIRQAKQKCEDPKNRLRIEPVKIVRELAQHLSSDYAYLVIKPPDRK